MVHNLHHLQLACCVNAPPRRGPVTEATCMNPSRTPVYAGRIEGSIVLAMMVKPPEKMPAAPEPAIARPAMSALLDGAVAHMSEPSSKTKRQARYVHLRENCWNSLPLRGWQAELDKNVRY